MHSVVAFKQMQQDSVAAAGVKMLLDALLYTELRPGAVEFTVPLQEHSQE